MHLRFGETVDNHFTANLLVNLVTKEFLKSVKILLSCCCEFGVFYFWNTMYSGAVVSTFAVVHLWRKQTGICEFPVVRLVKR